MVVRSKSHPTLFTFLLVQARRLRLFYSLSLKKEKEGKRGGLLFLSKSKTDEALGTL